MRPLLVLAVLGLALSASGPLVLAQSGSPELYQVIVNPMNQATSVDRHFVEDAFLKKATRWRGDEVIRPVDLAPGSPVRDHFSQDVLRRSVEAVKGYWQQRIFSGRDTPPPELDSDDQVVAFVLKHEGAIGYVSSTAHLNGSKILIVVQ